MDIELRDVTKTYDGTAVVEDVTFTARSGRITGFVGRNGAGKSTTLRILLGLARADSGSAHIGGGGIDALPPGTVGFLLDPTFHPARTGRAHLRILTASLGLPDQAANDVLREVGLGKDGHTKVRKYSLGMRQRLGLASALIGAPQVLVLDEPVNGLDPDGVVWLRDRLRTVAHEGGTVLLSSHLLSELELVADDIVLIDRRVLWAGTLADAAGEDGGLEGFYRRVTGSADAPGRSDRTGIAPTGGRS